MPAPLRVDSLAMLFMQSVRGCDLMPLSDMDLVKATSNDLFACAGGALFRCHLLPARCLGARENLTIYLSCPASAPDFTVLSFYKIFGLPDLGALIVGKDSGHILRWRRYFGGSTVDMVLCDHDAWHARKNYASDKHYELHDQLEDRTLPFHSVVVLGIAHDVHAQLYHSMARISAHTTHLAKRLYDGLSALTHVHGLPLCRIYKEPAATYGDSLTQGAISLSTCKTNWLP